MSSAEDILALVRAGRGNRPASLHNGETEDVLAVTLALLVELGVALDRIDRLERTVATIAGTTLEQVREAPLGDAANAERDEAQAALIARALRIFFDERSPSNR